MVDGLAWCHRRRSALLLTALCIALVSCVADTSDESVVPRGLVEEPLVVATAGCTASAESGIPYTTFRIDDGLTEIYAMNDSGLMAGNLSKEDGAYRGFVFDGDRKVDIFTLNGETAIISDINVHGDVAGRSGISVSMGFVRDRNGSIRQFVVADDAEISSITGDGLVTGFGRSVDHVTGFTNSAEAGTIHYDVDTNWDVRLAAVNDNGWAAGTLDGPGRQFEGFVVDPSGLSTTLRVNDVRATIIRDMNERGDVTGNYIDDELSTSGGFVRYASGELITFDIDGNDTMPSTINDRGEVAGTYVSSVGDEGRTQAGFFRSASGVTTTVSIPGADHTVIEDLTNSGNAVGHTSPPGRIRSTTVGFAIDFRSQCAPG